MFGTRFHQEQRRATANLQLWITLADLCSPGPKIIAVSSPYGQSQIEIQIPPGLEDGDSIRYPRMAPGQQDLVITYRIRPDADWQRDGLHLITERTVDIWQAIQGTNIRIATLRDTEIELSIPPMTQNGTILRIKGHGLLAKNSTHSGDLMIKIMLRLPDSIPEGIMAEIQRMTPK